MLIRFYLTILFLHRLLLNFIVSTHIIIGAIVHFRLCKVELDPDLNFKKKLFIRYHLLKCFGQRFSGLCLVFVWWSRLGNFD